MRWRGSTFCAVLVVLFIMTNSSSVRSQDRVEAASEAVGASVLNVRVGRNKGFTRIVFDWERRVEYTVNVEGRRVTVTFERLSLIHI